MVFSVAIIGLGKIGLEYDQFLSREEYVLSHSRAFYSHSGFYLVAGVDIVEEKRMSLRNFYGVKAYSCVEELVKEVRPDVIVIANPTKEHYAAIKSILSYYNPIALLCEKPLAMTQEQSQAILNICNKHCVPFYVNFIRRADPGIKEIYKRINQKIIMPPYKAVIWYSKGVLHNGLHYIDLLTYWFGEIIDFSIIDPGEKISKFDAEPDFRLQFEQASAIFCAASESNFSHYTVEIIAANGRLFLEKDGNISWQPVEENRIISGYRQLQKSAECIPNRMAFYQLNITDELFMALNGMENSLCTGAQALKTQSVVNEILTEVLVN